MITHSYTGTAREQWALAAIDVALGLVTAAELLELGERLMREFDEAEEQRGLVDE